MANSVLKNLILQGAEHSGLLNLLQRFGSAPDQSVYTLAYHRVAEFDRRPWLSPALISATPRQFDEQMRFVAEHYHPISIHDLLQTIHGEGALPKNSILVTVDDGYRDFKDEIVPICKRYGIRPLLFLPTAFVGVGNFWWDKLYQIIYLSDRNLIDTPFGEFPIASKAEKRRALEHLTQSLKSMPFEKAMHWVDVTHSALVTLTNEQQHNTLTWNELRQLVKDGVAVACHTHTHPLLTRISIENARHEVRIAQELIRHELGSTLPVFAFPDGRPHAFSRDLFEMLHSEGFEILFLLVGGQIHLQVGNRKTVLPRLSVWQSQTLPQLHMRLTPFWAFYESAILNPGLLKSR